MYKKFYGLYKKPFKLPPDPRFLYLTPKHRSALSCLKYGLSDGIGFILLTGTIGAGKTLLIKHLLNQLRTERVDIAVLSNTNIDTVQLLNLILEEFGQPAGLDDKTKALSRLNKFLQKIHSKRRKALLIIDEAQNLSDEVLEEVRMLSNLQVQEASLLQIILVGQPELRTNLKAPSLMQLAQRISLSYHLEPLDREETETYIRHRLKLAGGQADLFTKEAVDIIHQVSGGIPRSINLVCDLSLVYGFADEMKQIEGQVVTQVVLDKGIGLISEEEESAADIPDEAVKARETLKNVAERFRKEAGIEEEVAAPQTPPVAPPAAPARTQAAKRTIIAFADPTIASDFLNATLAAMPGSRRQQSGANGMSAVEVPLANQVILELVPIQGLKKFFFLWDQEISRSTGAIYLINAGNDLQHAEFFKKRFTAAKTEAPIFLATLDNSQIDETVLDASGPEQIRELLTALAKGR